MNKFIGSNGEESFEVWVENVATGEKERANSTISVSNPDPIENIVREWNRSEKKRAKEEMGEVRVRYFIARVITVRAVEEVVA